MSEVALEDVSVDRGGRRVLHGLSARFPSGRLTAVIGPNGAGKSTLLSACAGLLKPAEGRVLLGGRPIAVFARRPLARLRAYLPQNPQVDWPISVERLVALGLTPSLPLFGGLPDPLRRQVDQALEAYDLLDLRERPADALSGGERSRAMLARAAVGEPEVLIVDEPTAGLDPRHALDAIRRLRAHAGQGRSVIMAVHDLDLAARAADEVLALKDGRVLAAGRVEAVFTEAVLTRLYDVPARIVRDGSGIVVRFQ
ncbi:MAG TPA: ABC transporter ATP-binding protein [Caulobacteraceae bacterium]|jgi:iron complex transport system ATP-binding protein